MFKTTIVISLFCLLTQTYLFGQKANPKTNKIDMYAYHLDTIKATSDTIAFLFDSVRVEAQVQVNKIVATCLFINSKSVLTIRFYSKDNELISVKTREQSPVMDDMYAYCFFYYDKGELFDENYRWTVRACMAIPIDKSIYELYGYNPSLNAKFLKTFVLQLYDKIKLQTTTGFMQFGLDKQTSANSKYQLHFQQTNNYQLLYITSSTYFQSAAAIGRRDANSQPA